MAREISSRVATRAMAFGYSGSHSAANASIPDAAEARVGPFMSAWSAWVALRCRRSLLRRPDSHAPRLRLRCGNPEGLECQLSSPSAVILPSLRVS